MLDVQGAPGRVPRGAGSVLAASKEALGKVDQVQGGPFWRVLDRPKFARAQLLVEKVGGFYDFRFSLERFLEGPEGVPGAWGRATGIPKGGPGRCTKFTLGPRGGSQNEKGSSTNNEGCPGRPKTEAEGPGEKNYQRSLRLTGNRIKKDLSRPGPMAQRIFFCLSLLSEYCTFFMNYIHISIYF